MWWQTLLHYFLVVIEVLVCLLLLAAILIQKPRSHGMGLSFGVGMGETLFGAQVGNVMTRITVVLSILFIVNTLFLTLFPARSHAPSITDTVQPTPIVPTSAGVSESVPIPPVPPATTAAPMNAVGSGNTGALPLITLPLPAAETATVVKLHIPVPSPPPGDAGTTQAAPGSAESPASPPASP